MCDDVPGPAGADVTEVSLPSPSLADVHRQIFFDRSTITRRVESVSFLPGVVRERRISLDVDMALVLDVYRRAQVPVGDTVDVPLILQPKGLIFDFDISVDGHKSSAPARDLDSAITTDILLSLGESVLCGEQAPAEARALVNRICYAFREQDKFCEAVCSIGLANALGASDLGASPSDSARDWLLRAADSVRWGETLELAASNYLVVQRLPATSRSVVIKLRIVENAEEVPDADTTAIAATAPTIPLAVTFTGTGLARSEHFRIAAPPGMFFAAGLLLPRDEANFRYISESAIDRQVYYTNLAPTTGLTAVAMVAPNKRNFVAPASIITVAMFVFLAIGAFSGWYRDELTKLNASVEAIATIGFFVPGVAIAYLMRSEDHELRYKSLRRTQKLTSLTLIPMFAAVASLLPPEGTWHHNVLNFTWTICAGGTGLLALFVVSTVRRIVAFDKAVQANKGLRREWVVGLGFEE